MESWLSLIAWLWGQATSRPLRIEFPGAMYHDATRGDEREVIEVVVAAREQELATNPTNTHEGREWACEGAFVRALGVKLCLLFSRCVEETQWTRKIDGIEDVTHRVVGRASHVATVAHPIPGCHVPCAMCHVPAG